MRPANHVWVPARNTRRRSLSIPVDQSGTDRPSSVVLTTSLSHGDRSRNRACVEAGPTYKNISLHPRRPPFMAVFSSIVTWLLPSFCRRCCVDSAGRRVPVHHTIATWLLPSFGIWCCVHGGGRGVPVHHTIAAE